MLGIFPIFLLIEQQLVIKSRVCYEPRYNDMFGCNLMVWIASDESTIEFPTKAEHDTDAIIRMNFYAMAKNTYNNNEWNL